MPRGSITWTAPSPRPTRSDSRQLMSDLTPELVPEVLAACEAGADEASSALSRSLDAEFTLAVGEAGTYSATAPPEGFEGPGLAVLMQFGDQAAVALIPESSGLLPEWYANPDPTGESKLSTLAQELSMLLVPDTIFAEDFRAARVPSLTAALESAAVADGASLVALPLSVGDHTSQLSLVWPANQPDELLPAAEAEDEQPTASAVAASPSAARPKIEDFSQLPGYTRSLLRIKMPVHVVLASKKENLKEIVELAPGSIIKFDKACDEMLTLQVGEQQVAVGEAVKVGDKFGFRVSNMVLPDEHFQKVRPQKRA